MVLIENVPKVFDTNLANFALIFACFLACSGCIALFFSLNAVFLLVLVQHALRFIAIIFWNTCLGDVLV